MATIKDTTEGVIQTDDIGFLADFYSGRFDEPMGGWVLTEKAKKASLKNARKNLRRWLEILDMSGFMIVKKDKYINTNTDLIRVIELAEKALYQVLDDGNYIKEDESFIPVDDKPTGGCYCGAAADMCMIALSEIRKIKG